MLKEWYSYAIKNTIKLYFVNVLFIIYCTLLKHTHKSIGLYTKITYILIYGQFKEFLMVIFTVYNFRLTLDPNSHIRNLLFPKCNDNVKKINITFLKL